MSISKCLFLAVVIASLQSSYPALALSDSDRDKLTTYTTVLGRAMVCGVDIDEASRRVGKWIDRIAKRGSDDQAEALSIFMTGVTYSAKQQKDGLSPDTCTSIQQQFPGF